MSASTPRASLTESVGLTWGIKQSFVAYVRGTPGARGSATDGAALVGGDRFHFPADPAVSAGAAGGRLLTFRGDVRFSGHGGLLYVRIAHPWLRIADGSGELTVEDLYETPGAERILLATMRLTRLPASPGLETWYGTDVVLSPAGTGLFDDVYGPGEPFDSLTATVATPSGTS